MIGHLVAMREEDVVGLEVAVNDARGVGGLERRRDSVRDLERASHRQSLQPVDLVRERRPFEVLEHDVRHLVAREPHVRRLDDVGVTERADGTSFVHEALDHVGVGRELRMQDLDREPALDEHVLGEIDRPHSTGSDLSDDPVAPLDHVSRLEDRISGQCTDPHPDAIKTQWAARNNPRSPLDYRTWTYVIACGGTPRGPTSPRTTGAC